jgi:hypothetical protein
MKYIKLFEEYDEEDEEDENFEDYDETALDYANRYYRDETGHLPYGDYYEILDRLNNFCTTDFPYGIKNIPDPVTLYRLLNVDSIDDIDKDKLGKYYVGDKEMFEDEAFLDSFFYRYGEDVKKWFIVTIETSRENLDIQDMLGNRAEYPEEYQVTIRNDRGLKIIDIEEIEPIYT